MIIGAHISASGGLDQVFARAQKIEVQAIQCFASPPSNWHFRQPSDDVIKSFIKQKSDGNYQPIFFHGIYLMNFASPDEQLVTKSQQSLINYLNLSATLGIDGVIFHLGSTKQEAFETGLERLITNLEFVLQESDPSSILIMENSAGAGGTIGKNLAQFQTILQALHKYDHRIKFCFDTCHAYVSGYDIADSKGVNALKQNIAQNIGSERVIALHINDAKGALASNLDRHANIGEGNIGIKGFQILAQDSYFGQLPWILEVPGFDNQGPDLRNVEILKGMQNKVI